MSGHRTPGRGRAAFVLAAGVLLGACDSELDPGETTVRITAYGEQYIEDRIPAEVMADGWEIELSSFLVAIDELEVEGEPLPGAYVVDLRAPSMGRGHALGEVSVLAEGHPHLRYRIAPPTAAHAVVAAETDVTQMIDEGVSIRLAGEARRGDRTVRFAWGFSTATRYEQCHGRADLGADDPAEIQVTLHADHLFYDDLDAPEPNVAFDLVAAADADADGEVTVPELRAVDIRSHARYQVGSREIVDLGQFIAAQTQTLGHVDGEGHCERGL